MKRPILPILMVLLLLAACDAPPGGDRGSDKNSDDEQRSAENAEPSDDGRGDGTGGGARRKQPDATGTMGKFPSGDNRPWRGFEKGKCGTRVHFVDAGGMRHDLSRPENLFDGLETIDLVTAEANVRDTVALDVLLVSHAAQSVTFHGCDGESHTVQLADHERYRLLLNGKGLLKLLLSHQDGPPTSPVKTVEHLEFHAGE